MQFFHYARQEKEKAVSECQLRYQALVKAAAGMRSSDTTTTATPTSLQSPSFSLNRSENLENGGGGRISCLDECFSSPSSSCEYGGNEDIEGGNLQRNDEQQQQQNGARRKLYFSSGKYSDFFYFF